MSKPDEAAFETHVAEWLAANGGYEPVKRSVGGGGPHFDAELGLGIAELFAFIGATQPEQWEQSEWCSNPMVATLTLHSGPSLSIWARRSHAWGLSRCCAGA